LKTKKVLILLLLALILPPIQPVIASQSSRIFEEGYEVVPGEASKDAPLLNPLLEFANGNVILPSETRYYNLTEAKEHYFKVALAGGQRLSILAFITGVREGRVVLSLYEGDNSTLDARITTRWITFGVGDKCKAMIVYQPSIESAKGENKYYYIVLRGYSGQVKYRLNIILEPRYDWNKGTDAGNEPKSAIKLPILTVNERLRFNGYLSDRDEGDDYIDVYELPVKYNSSHDILRIELTPSKSMFLDASISQRDLILKRNSSSAKGEPITLTLRGIWKTNETYTYYLKIGNSEGRGGGRYTVQIEISSPKKQPTVSTTQTRIWFFKEGIIKLILILSAILLVIIAAIILFLRRKRAVRVEEWGWGWEETW